MPPHSPQPKAMMRTILDKLDLFYGSRAFRISCSITSSRGFGTFKARVFRPGSITRITVSIPGQPGSLQAISLTAKAVSGETCSASP